MARGVNKVILIGNLGQDPDTRYTPNGNAVVNLNLATDESYKDRQTGQRQQGIDVCDIGPGQIPGHFTVFTRKMPEKRLSCRLPDDQRLIAHTAMARGFRNGDVQKPNPAEIALL